MPAAAADEISMSRLRALWQASVNATKRAVVWNSEDLIPPNERYIFNFNSKDELTRWHLYSDSEYGGLSSASLEITDGAAGGDASSIDTMSSTPLIFPACMCILKGVFSGNLSFDMSEGSTWRIRRSDFCGMRSKKGCKTSYMQRTSTLKVRCCCFILCSRQGLRQDMMAKSRRKLRSQYM